MKKSFLPVLLLVGWACFASTESRAESWERVNEALAAGLPRTALERLEPILNAAIEAGDHAEAVRAVGTAVALEGRVQGHRPEERIVRLEARMEDLPGEMYPLLNAILGHWYWDYFQQNRWRFMQRTRTAEPPGEDFTTWDLPRILGEIDRRFSAALEDRERLRAIPVGDFDAVLEKGTVPDNYRPTLYDFLVHEALSFYAAGEQGVMQVEDAFVLTAESPVFDPIDAFLDWERETADTDSPTYKAIRLYQELLAFHQAEGNRDALLDADLGRFRFGYNTAVGPEKDARYGDALERFADEHSDHEIFARALFHLAGLHRDRDNPAEAHRLASRGAEAFPDSVGGAWCLNLLAEIERKSASLVTERVWNRPWPDIRVTYRNVDRVYFRAVPYDFENLIQHPLHHDREAFLSRLVSREPAKAWRETLPPTEDYRERTELLPAPEDLEPGFYILLASHDPEFGAGDNQITFVPVWVSDLAVVTRHTISRNLMQGLVVEARTGDPVAGATVRAAYLRQRQIRWSDPVETDRSGMFALQPETGGHFFVVEHGGQRVATDHEYWYSQQSWVPDPESTVFFSDRALYRPGQTIQYKGISLRRDSAANDYRALDGRNVTVALIDPNGREVARRSHRTNDYGSFSGSFPAPDGGLTGALALRVVDGPRGGTSVRVEEYKRPRFRVELEAPEEAPRLDDVVTLGGRASAYTGAAVGDAVIRWRVEREVRFPPWCWWGPWRWGPGGGESQAIAHGSARTGPDGRFEVTFSARPDPSVPASDEPTFWFRVHVDITDAAGETRSASRSVPAGYTALKATLVAEDWQTPEKPVVLTVTTASLEDVPQPAAGTVSVYTLRQPERPARRELDPVRPLRWPTPNGEGPAYDAANPDTWENAERVVEMAFRTGPAGAEKLEFNLPAGIYRASLEATDRFGNPVTARRTILVADPDAATFPVAVASHFSAPYWSLEPGETFQALWATGYESGRALVEVEHNGERLQRYWSDPERTQTLIEQTVTEEMRGGFTVRVTQVSENRLYVNERVVAVPWSDRKLSVRWERFRSNLEPGQRETWTAVIEGPDAEKAAAEMVATLYDASLDQYLPHRWNVPLGGFRTEYSRTRTTFHNRADMFVHLAHWMHSYPGEPEFSYRRFPQEIVGRSFFFGGRSDFGFVDGEVLARTAAPVAEAMAVPAREMAVDDLVMEQADALPGTDGPRAPDLDSVPLRENLNETAFFFPHLTANEDGVVRMEFTMPEALTEWRFIGFAHDSALRNGVLEDKVVTSKELMVQPLAPRFVREGDVIEFPVTVSNESAARQSGRVRLTLHDARTLDSRDAELGNVDNVLEFDIPSKESRTFFWRIAVPDGMDFLIYRASAATTRLSDGEEGYLPVLSRRILVTESLPLPIRGRQTREFTFDKLLASGDSATLRNEFLTVQMASQPAWYAVMALPYLMESRHESSDQVFNRIYANSLARHIANADPAIRRVFHLWRNTPALDSPLEKNEDLKALALEETPWLRQARNESEARRQVGVLFEDNRLDDELTRAFRRLAEAQRSDGFWPWFSGGQGNPYITLYITTGFARLRHLGATVDLSLAERSLEALDGWMQERYEQLRREENTDGNRITPLMAFYLYGRSYFLPTHPIRPEHREALDFWQRQGREHWTGMGRQSQAHLALGLHRFGDRETPVAIMNSIREHAVFDEEMGMHWRDLERNWWWYRAPIETQALMIEAFDEIMGDAEAVEEAKVWLLKQKQTQDWKTTKATADAVYAILLRGTDLLGSDALVEVTLGGERVEPGEVEPGTGFYEARYVRAEIRPEMGEIKVTKPDDGVSWGSIHWQYLEDIGNITPHEETPLQLRKRLFLKETTARGPELRPAEGMLAVGDELVVRVELRVDRDMEYVHLKDQRGSGTEPVNVLSGHRFQDGLRYYESTRDTAGHFFIEYLPRGVYVFEYSVHIRHRGTYQSGIATVQSMYAPEFNSHSESFELTVE